MSRRADHSYGRCAEYPRRKNYSERSATARLTHAIKATQLKIGGTVASVSGSVADQDFLGQGQPNSRIVSLQQFCNRSQFPCSPNRPRSLPPQHPV